MQGMGDPSLVGELRSPMPRGDKELASGNLQATTNAAISNSLDSHVAWTAFRKAEATRHN